MTAAHVGDARAALEPFVRPGQDADRPGTFDFLGFTHIWARSRRGNWVVRRKTARDRFRRLPSDNYISPHCRDRCVDDVEIVRETRRPVGGRGRPTDGAGLPRQRSTGQPRAVILAEHTSVLPRPEGLAFRLRAHLKDRAMDVSPDLNPNVHSRLAIFRALLAPLRPGRLLDLATGHGCFAIAAHDLGWSVTAVDVRTARFPDHPGIEWIHGDILEFAFERPSFDVVTLLGILYHLTLREQLRLLGRCAGGPTIVDTHVSERGDIEQEGYYGHLVDEGQEEVRRADNLASWDNRWSWWGTIESTERMLRAAGFQHTFRLSPSWSEERRRLGAHEEARTWWWCL